MEHLYSLRKLLHQNAELSHKEEKTSEILKDYISKYNPDKVINFNYGFVAIFDSGITGKTVMFRADIDALPIEEVNQFEYVSKNKNVAHLCGHDGHSTILVGLCEKIAQNRPKSGKVVLLFQHAEEVGEGANYFVEHNNFKEIEPDYIFGLHNIPSYPQGSSLIKKGSFACASRGMIVKLHGKTSHAAEPENGITPVYAVEKIINSLKNVETKLNFKDFTLATIIHIKLGERAFGTTPGYAEVMVTLRSSNNEDMDKLINYCENNIKNISSDEKLKFEIEYTEIFPAVINDDECVEIIENASHTAKIDVIKLDKPFKWSEDFAYFTEKYKGAFFGLGSGKSHPQLHNPNYDFPNEIIEKGIDIFKNIYLKLYKNKNEN